MTEAKEPAAPTAGVPFVPSLISDVTLAETHISVLFFVGDRVYKWKKPVRFPFVDLSTREARERLCHREVELNRRLAPDVYLGVADLSGEDGRVCDHLVVMRRMPADRRLSDLVRRCDPDVETAISDVARLVAGFHANAGRGPQIDAAATVEAVAARWRENFVELRPFAGTVLDSHRLDRAEQLSEQFLAGRRALFEDRIATGQIVDGHGDLQTDDIFCLPDGPRILDCIEFCDAFRFGDVANDMAFLVMDLERLGAPRLGVQLVRVYETASGRNLPPALLRFYIAYRAQVRAKVACLRSTQETPGSRELEESVDAARRLLDLCLERLEDAAVRLIMVGGLPGTGKSTLARRLSDALGYRLLRSDVIRKQLAGMGAHQSATADYESGLYTASATDRVYGELIERACHSLQHGESVVLDASFTADQHRQLARELAQETAAEMIELHCVLDPREAAQRIETRRQSGVDPSDADAHVAEMMAKRADPWPQATKIPTHNSPDMVELRALDALCCRPRDTR